MLKSFISLVMLTMVCVPPATGGLILYDFQFGMPADLTPIIDPPLTGSLGIVADYVLFSGSGFVGLVTEPIWGDFHVSTFARTQTLHAGSLGLALYYDWPPSTGSPFANIYRAGYDGISSNIFVDSDNQASNSMWADPAPTIFEIVRTGNTVVTKYTYGGSSEYGVLTFTDPALAAAARVGIFLDLESQAWGAGRFYWLAIKTPDESVPESATGVLVASTLLLLCAFRRWQTAN